MHLCVLLPVFHSECGEAWGQVFAIGFLLQPCSSQGLNTIMKAWQQVLSPTEPSCQPDWLFFFFQMNLTFSNELKVLQSCHILPCIMTNNTVKFPIYHFQPSISWGSWCMHILVYIFVWVCVCTCACIKALSIENSLSIGFAPKLLWQSVLDSAYTSS